MQETENLLAQRFRTHPDTFVESGPDGTFMLLPDGQTVTLNPVAEFIWSMLDGERTALQVLDEIVKEFAVPSREVAQSDMLAFLERLQQTGLIQHAE